MSAVVALWDFKRGPEGTAAQQRYGHVDRISGLAWQHRGDRLASIGLDARLLLWHPDRQDLPLADHDLISIPTTVAFAADDRWLATGGDSGELNVFAVADARP